MKILPDLMGSPIKRGMTKLSPGLFCFALVFGINICVGQMLRVVVKNVKSSSGSIRLALYSNEKDFMKKEFSIAQEQASEGETVVLMPGVPLGTYAIGVIHDTNDNKELDTNLIGVPKEGFGFSNDAMGLFGPPGFEKASFEFDGNKEVSINLRYF